MRAWNRTLGFRSGWLGRCTIVVAVGILATGCVVAQERGGPGVEGTPVSTPTKTSSNEPTTTTAKSTSTAAPSTTIPGTSTSGPNSAPVIHLSGSPSVFSLDGTVTIKGWIDGPAMVKVGPMTAVVIDDPYAGVSTFETVLELEPGEHSITITATDATGAENTVLLSVLVDPTLETHLAYVQDIDPAAGTIIADYVDFFAGEEATEAARADGVISGDEEMPGGFYLRNQNSRLRSLPLGDPLWITLQACYPDNGPCVVEEAVNLDTWIGLLAQPESAPDHLGWHWYGYDNAPCWLTIQDGTVVQITEQYLP